MFSPSKLFLVPTFEVGCRLSVIDSHSGEWERDKEYYGQTCDLKYEKGCEAYAK